MTLKTRNRFILIFTLLSIIQALYGISYFVLNLLNSNVAAPENAVRSFSFLSPLIPYSFTASVASIIIFHIYVCAASIMVFLTFEKTQAPEITFFMGFLLGIDFDASRIFVPVNGILNSSWSLFFIARLVLTGRILCPMALLFATLLRENEQRHNIERNFLIMLIVSSFTGLIFPLRSSFLTTTNTIPWGYPRIIKIYNLIVVFLTALTMLNNFYQTKSRDALIVVISYVIMICGYFLLCSADNYIFLPAGIFLFFAGTFYYLKKTHSNYLWK